MKTPNYTKEQLCSWSVHDRHELWKKVRTRTDVDAQKIKNLLEKTGLPYSSPTCVTNDDPITHKMHDIIAQEDSRAAMIAATEQGLPAISGVDRKISEALGVDYGGHNMTTNTAGSLVAERMHELGYRNTGRKGKLPDGCVAKSGEIFVSAK